MGKATVIVDDKLLYDAMRASGAKTKKEAITTGLRESASRKSVEALRRELSTFDLAPTLRELERPRRD